MAQFSLQDLINPLTTEECETALYGYLDAVGAPTTNWKAGGVVHTIIYVYCILYSFATYLIAGIASSGFLLLAEGPWLTIKARYDYDVERLDATFATGNVVLTNTSGVPYTVAAYDLTVAAPDLDTNYRNTASFVLPGNGSVTVPIDAVEQGSASNATAGQISKLVTSLAGVTCTNPGSVAGLDAEKDDALKVRAVASAAALSPDGPAAAYEYAARSAKRADGTSCGVNKIRLVNDSAGHLDVFVATSFGGVPGTVGDLTTDLGCVSDAVHRNAVPLGITVDVSSCTVVDVTVTYTAWLYSSVNRSSADVLEAQETALSARIDRLPVGGDKLDDATPGALYRAALQAAIADAYPEHTIKVDVSNADLTLDINAVARFVGAFGTIRFVNAPEGAV